MPIEVNRVNKPCPKCKNPTIFWNGKNYFCGKCLSDIPKEEIQTPEPICEEIIEVAEKELAEAEVVNEESKPIENISEESLLETDLSLNH